MDSVEVKVPDIGEFTDVDVIEVMVKPGDTVGVDDPLIAIESEKATMEVPAPQAGVVKEIKVKLGDKVSEGSLILVMEADAATASTASQAIATPAADANGAARAETIAATKPETSAAAKETKGTQSAPGLRLVTAADGAAGSVDSAPAASSRSADASPQAAPSESWDDGAGEHPFKPHASPSVRKFA